MTEHEMLKAICDEIWYEIENNWFIYEWDLDEDEWWWFFKCNWNCWLDVREIIFTPEFMDKFVKYYDNKKLLWPKRIYENIWIDLFMSNLHDPVPYLYNLIFNK